MTRAPAARSMRLAELLPDVAGIADGLVITGLVQDSRQLAAGDAFVAIVGEGAHGLHFVEQARTAGAAAIVFEPPAPAECPAPADAIAVPGLGARLGEMADRFHGSPSAAMTTVGVTGTNGKTSTVQLLAQAWELAGTRSASIGTLGAGLYGQVEPTGFTTPLVLQTHALLAQLHDAGAQAMAMEVSSHALDQGRVDGVHFDVAVYTNLTRDHLDYHGDMSSYGAAKAKLFQWRDLQAAVINLDDAFGRELRAGLMPRSATNDDGRGQGAGMRLVGVSSRTAEGASVRAEALRLDAAGIEFDLIVDGQSNPVRSTLLGRFNVDNLLAVAGVLHALGQAPAEIAAMLSRLQPIPGRMGSIKLTQQQPLVVVDYAHTPDALQQALETLRTHAVARLLCVFGCGGERDAGKRPQMAAIAQAHADVVIVTDDNPRCEDGDAIVRDILAGFDRPEEVVVERDRKAAIARAIGQAGPDDIVLIAGKGHEAYQEINGVQHPFDDSQVARALLEAGVTHGEARP